MGNLDKEVSIINKIIVNAIIHGETRSPYYINEEALISSMNEYLEVKGLTGEYEIVDDIYYPPDDNLRGYWKIFQFRRK